MQWMPFQKPVRALMQSQIDCDVLPADALLDAAVVSDGKLQVAQESYACLVVPTSAALSTRLLQRLAELARAAGLAVRAVAPTVVALGAAGRSPAASELTLYLRPGHAEAALRTGGRLTLIRHLPTHRGGAIEVNPAIGILGLYGTNPPYEVFDEILIYPFGSRHGKVRVDLPPVVTVVPSRAKNRIRKAIYRKIHDQAVLQNLKGILEIRLAYPGKLDSRDEAVTGKIGAWRKNSRRAVGDLQPVNPYIAARG
jgi:hypothetical protein